MKYLDCPELQTIALKYLNHRDMGDYVIDGTLDAYSCKVAGGDKKLSKELDAKLVEEFQYSPSKMAMSPLGPLGQPSTHRLLISLISTMNATFPDYDFSNVRADQFTHEASLKAVANNINSLFCDIIEKTEPGFTARFWKQIDDVIDSSKCDIFSYIPDSDSEVFTVGKLWSFNYFFFNKMQKKILFVMASMTSKLHMRPDSVNSVQRHRMDLDDDEADESMDDEVEEEGDDWPADDLNMVDEPDGDTAWMVNDSTSSNTKP